MLLNNCTGLPLWLSWERIHLQRRRPGLGRFLEKGKAAAPAAAKSLQSYPTLWDPRDGNLSVLQSLIGISERLIAKALCPVYDCANSLRLSSYASKIH